MNYIKLNLPPTVDDLVRCQQLIDSKIKIIKNLAPNFVNVKNKDTPELTKEQIENICKQEIGVGGYSIMDKKIQEVQKEHLIDKSLSKTYLDLMLKLTR